MAGARCAGRSLVDGFVRIFKEAASLLADTGSGCEGSFGIYRRLSPTIAAKRNVLAVDLTVNLERAQ